MDRDRPYAGIGSRHTPPKILDLMRQVARRLMLENWLLRSGGANGADKAFHAGAGMISEIYTPEAVAGHIARGGHIWDADWRGAAAIARELYPQWEELNNLAPCHHTRTVCIILGRDLNHRARFLLCWTRDGATSAEEWGLDVPHCPTVAVRIFVG